ncbi:glucose-6-phosphate isomerase [Roseovarius aestuariivivens]|uniref:glucose-6-phosphate isomerase n=1 Tax=Roseovarius aestuariivivens TaxID=1888910 RepID=UPI0010810ECB|nr:glucose-6-phosphate isomerase [Roseovarius aestuariivivens]
MKTRLTAALAASALVLAGCQNMSQQQQDQITAGAIGATAGVVGAKILGANAGWTMVAAAAGAATGALIARNQRTGECAYSDGRGGYYTAAC